MNEQNQISQLPKILLIEDDEISVDVMKLFLKNFATVEISLNSEDAINKVKTNEYNLILMDINLGKGLTGIDLIRIIREIPYYKNIPILAVTAFAMKGDKEEFLSAGFDFYLAKPFTREELRATVKRFMK
ncbi:MAG: response regulator [Melioribacteraceae bacterium]|nr:response regulator [Melioribacteraceae bacterium]